MLRLTLSTFMLACWAAPVWATNVEPSMLVVQQTVSEKPRAGSDIEPDARPRPAHALEWVDALSEPAFMAEVMARSVDPEAWMRSTEKSAASNPASPSLRPDVQSEDFFAAIEPQYQQALLSRLLDPGKPMRWMKAMSDPRFFMNALAAMNPATAMQWMKVTADGRMFKAMQNGTDPKAHLNWVRMPASALPAQAGDKPPSPFAWKPHQRY